MIINTIDKASYLSAIGFKLGQIKGFDSIEILGDEDIIKDKLINGYYQDKVSPYKFIKEYNYIMYIARKKQKQQIKYK